MTAQEHILSDTPLSSHHLRRKWLERAPDCWGLRAQLIKHEICTDREFIEVLCSVGNHG